jgi:hypothetical protein
MDSKDVIEDSDYVTRDRCKLVSDNLEEKIDRNYNAIGDVKDLVNPKIELIVRMDAWLRLVKWIVIFLLTGSASTGIIWQAIKYFAAKK